MVRILALSHYFKGKSAEYSHYSHGQSERAAHNLPNSYAIICGKPHCAVLNYLGPVAPSFSNRVKRDATSCSVPCRTGPYWSDLVCSNSCMTQNGDPNRNSTEQSEPQKSAERGNRRKARKRRKAQKGLFWAGRPKKSVQIAAAQPVVGSGRLARANLHSSVNIL